MSDVPPPPTDQVERLVPTDVRDGTTDRGSQASTVWDGIVWGRLGRGDLAWRCWDEVDDPDLAAWVEAERGRVLRELGLHEQAEAHDLQGLRRAVDPIDELMLWIGLTADAVGQGEPDEVAIRLAAAQDALDAAPGGPRRDRQLLRLTWVETEAAALTGGEGPGGPWPEMGPAGLVFPEGFDAGTDFHRAKAALFRGAATADGRMLDAAADIAPAGLLWAVHLARADAGSTDALDAAREAWAAVVPPEHVADAAARTPTASRLSRA